jgi:hypothetical protein
MAVMVHRLLKVWSLHLRYFFGHVGFADSSLTHALRDSRDTAICIRSVPQYIDFTNFLYQILTINRYI